MINAISAVLQDPGRLSSLAATELFAADGDPVFDALTLLTRQLLGAPVSALSVITPAAQQLVSTAGNESGWLAARSALEYSICKTAVQDNAALFIEDTRADPIWSTHLAVTESGIGSYAGVPVHREDGTALGVICALSPQPRPWSQSERELLRNLANLTTAEVRRRELKAISDQLAQQLSARNHLLEVLLESMDEAVIATSNSGESWLVNAAARRNMGSLGRDLAPRLWPDRICLRDADGGVLPRDAWPHARAERGDVVRQLEVLCQSDEFPEGRWLSVNANPVRNDHGDILAAVSVSRDVTAQMHAKRMLSQHAAQLEDLYQRAPCGYHSLDATGLVVRMNDTELEWLQMRRDDVVGKRNYLDLLSESSRQRAREYWSRWHESGADEELELTLIDVKGRPREVLIRATAVRNEHGQFLMTRSTVIDISRRKAAEREVRRLAETDALTGLLNRRGFFERVEAALAESEHATQSFALIYLDLDGLKRVNDVHGHHAGDALIARAGQALGAAFPDALAAARMGGDEFAVALIGTAAIAATDRVATLQQGWRERSASSDISAPRGSFGVRVWPTPDFARLEDALAETDALMYREKTRRTGQTGVL
ncbi:diguanylate cyclase domain-containing protein [Ahniella affigens]|nr:diguanylate cyclase [Ahniella affigens]